MDLLDDLFRQNPNLERLMRPTPDELAGLSDSIRLLRRRHQSDPEDDEIVFQLAGALISHSRKSYVEEGVNLMQALVCARWQSNWSAIREQDKGLYSPNSAVSTGVVRGVAISHATAPPPSDDEDELGSSVVSVSTAAYDETEEDRVVAETGGSPPLPSSTGPTDGLAGATVVAGPDVTTASLALSTTPFDSTAVPPPHEDGSPTPPSFLSPDRHQPKCVKGDGSGYSIIAPGRGFGEMNELAAYHYYLALGWIKLDEMEKASSCVSQMLLLAPNNKQGQMLKQYIEVAGRRGAAVDAAALAGAGLLLASAAAVLGAFLRSRQGS